MIVRPLHADLLLITQVDHAALAGRIMTAWRVDGLPERPTRARVLEAARLHDLGWLTVDSTPSVNPETASPYGFVDAPLEVRQGVWTRALDQIAPQDAYVAALVAHHAATVYRRFLGRPGWDTFFTRMEHRRDELFARQTLDRDTFLQDYTLVRAGDLWSLAFCTDSQEPIEWGQHRATLHPTTQAREPGDGTVVHGGWLEITPDPFDGTIVPLDVPARRVPARRYASDADLRDTFARAPIVRLSGVAAGHPGGL